MSVHQLLNRYLETNLNINSDSSRNRVRSALAKYERFLGREADLSDFNDDSVTEWIASLRGVVSNPTVNSDRGRLVAFWNWMAKKRHVGQFPVVPRLKEPDPEIPAWTEAELKRIWAVLKTQSGCISGIPADQFLVSLHNALLDTGERFWALLGTARASWLDIGQKTLSVPPEARKGGIRRMVYPLRGHTLRSIQTIVGNHELIWPWPYSKTTWYTMYKKILASAGLPHDRKRMGQCMRRTFASHVAARGGDAQLALRHSSGDITSRYYTDRNIARSRFHENLPNPN